MAENYGNKTAFEKKNKSPMKQFKILTNFYTKP